jgi:hypothetical protein
MRGQLRGRFKDTKAIVISLHIENHGPPLVPRDLEKARRIPDSELLLHFSSPSNGILDPCRHAAGSGGLCAISIHELERFGVPHS